MELFRRRSAFIFVEELGTVEDTKNLLISKFQFLQGQLKLTFNSISKSDSVSPEFVKNSFFLFDFQSKLVATLLKLASSSDIEWFFIKRWSAADSRPYLLGEFKYPGFLLDTYRIDKYSEVFFFELLKLGIIDKASWLYLNKLRDYSSSIGISPLNDQAYFERKGVQIYKPIEDKNELADFRFNEFVDKPLQFSDHKPIVSRLFRLMDAASNKALVASMLKAHAFRYVDMKRDKQILTIPTDQYMSLMDMLDEVNSFESLYRARMEMLVLNKTEPADSDIFKFLSDAFFSRPEYDLFLKKELAKSKSFLEKMVDVILWVDFLICMCTSSINMYVSAVPELARSNFELTCRQVLAPLLDKGEWHKMFLVHVRTSELLLDKVKQLQTMTFYKKNYAKLLDEYFVFGSN